ncbi:MAG: hypothetical protein EXR96_00595 [Nitrospiraceae bacterium]|nr:hypothetical protein [Nitrospiraceae bacterium]
MRRLLNLCTTVVLLFAGTAHAQEISIIQGSDGTSGTVMELGNGFRTYSDSHGNMGTIMDLGGGYQTYQFTSPHGGTQSGTILTLPAPRSSFDRPPAGLTPAPVLPFTPRGPLMPREQMAPVVPLTPNTGTFNTFGNGGGRIGR